MLKFFELRNKGLNDLFCRKEEGEDQQMTYTLTFTVSFPHEGDTVYFASCYPYTYTNLQNYLWDLSNHPVKSTFTTLRLLCKSLAGNNIDYITITSPPEEEENKVRFLDFKIQKSERLQTAL